MKKLSLLALLLGIALLSPPAPAAVQQQILCNIGTSAACSASSNTGTGTSGMPAWQFNGVSNANFNLLFGMFGGSSNFVTTGTLLATDVSSRWTAGGCSGAVPLLYNGNCLALGTGVATALGVNVGTAGAPVVNGGAGGTPSSITLTNATGYPQATSSTYGIVKPDNSTITISGGTITAIGGSATSIVPGTTTIGGATAPCMIENTATTVMGCTAVTGTGNVVLATSPTLVTPALGTPSALVATNATGTAAGLSIGGNAATATTATNLAGGTANQIPYQTGAGATSFFSAANYGVQTYGATGVPGSVAGAAGVLQGSAAAIPAFTTTPTITCTNCSGTAASLNIGGNAATATTASAAPLSGITGLGTGVGTALGINVGTAGSPVVNGGAGGTPSSITLTNGTGYPQATSSTYGIVKPDNSTITISGGTITAIGGSATSIVPGTTTVGGATAPCLIDNSASTTMGCAAIGAGLALNSGTLGLSISTRTVTVSPTFAAGDMGGVIFSNVSGGGTATIPAISSTVFANGMGSTIVNYSASTEAVSTTPTVNSGGGCVTGTGIPAGATWELVSNGTTIDCNQTIPSASGGSGTVASSSTGQVPVYTAATTVTGSANFTISTGALTLGASGTLGSVQMGNATSGTVTLAPVTGALGAVTASLPANTGTVAELNLAQSFSALQTFGTNISIGGVTAGGATGTGNVVFSTSPTLTTPALGTPSALVATNATGTAAGLSIGGNAATATTASAAPLSGITGLGTGVGTALGINVGTAGAPVVNGGAGGTPSSITLTNGTGLPLAGLATQAANTIDCNATGGGASPTACSAAAAIGLINSATPNAQTGTSYTPVLGDANLFVTMNNASANTFCVPPNSSVAYPVGTSLTVEQLGAGITTVAPAGASGCTGSGVTLDSAQYGASSSQTYALAKAYDFLQIKQTATNVWLVSAVGPGRELQAGTANLASTSFGGVTGTLVVGNGGTGVATLTGPIKGNGTSAFSAAAAADIYGLWSGTCSSSTFLRGDGSCQTPAGSGTITSSTTGQIPVYTAATTVGGSANFTISTGALTLGASGTLGSVQMGNATSGTITLAPVTGALGAVTASLPANTGTVAELNLAQTWTAAQTQQLVIPSVNSVSTATSITPNCTYNQVKITASATGTFTVNAPGTCTPADGQRLVLKVISPAGGTITYAWNAAYIASTTLALPTASLAASKEDYFSFAYDSDKSGWVFLADNQEF